MVLSGKSWSFRSTRRICCKKPRRQSGQRVAGGVATHRTGFVAGEQAHATARMMVRRAVKAGRADDWSVLMKSDEFNFWMMAKLKQCHEQAEQEGDQRKSIEQRIMQSTE